MDLTGRIAIIHRGTCVSAIKVALSQSLGAVAVIIYNNTPGTLNGYSLQRFSVPEGEYLPTGGITEANGEAIVARLAAGEDLIADLSSLTEGFTTFIFLYTTIETKALLLSMFLSCLRLNSTRLDLC